MEPVQWEYECLILNYLHKNQKLKNELTQGKNVEEAHRILNALKNLIDNNIVRQTSTVDQGKIYELHSPKYALALKKLLEK